MGRVGSEFLSLLSHKLDVTTPEVYTEQGVPVMADEVVGIDAQPDFFMGESY